MKNEIINKIKFVDLNSQPKPEEPLITYNGSNLFCKGDIGIITGQSGTGKSKTLMNIIGNMFTKDIDSLGLEIANCPEDHHVIYINTELSYQRL